LGYCERAKLYKGFTLWSLSDLLNKVFEICTEWDNEVFTESIGKCIKPHLNRHNIHGFEGLHEKCSKCDDEIQRWEKEYRKVKFEKDKEINEIFESVEKEWVEK
jgi:hypothetical protein